MIASTLCSTLFRSAFQARQTLTHSRIWPASHLRFHVIWAFMLFEIQCHLRFHIIWDFMSLYIFDYSSTIHSAHTNKKIAAITSLSPIQGLYSASLQAFSRCQALMGSVLAQKCSQKGCLLRWVLGQFWIIIVFELLCHLRFHVILHIMSFEIS